MNSEKSALMPAINALIVEDDSDDAELLARKLRDAGYEVHWTRVETEPDFLAALRTPLDIIFSDFSMPRFGGLRAIELLRASGLDVPLILVSGAVGEEVAVEAMRVGATDYLLKDRTARLASAVHRALDDARLRAERQRTQEALRDRDQRLRSIIDNTMDGITVISADGRVSEMNRAGLTLLQAESLAAVQARRCADFVLPPNQQAFYDMNRDILAGRSGRLEFEVQGLAGGRCWIETQAGPLRSSDGTVEAVICIMRDVTERKRAEQQIRGQLEELQRWRAVTLGREDRVIALKSEVNALLKELGRSTRYSMEASKEYPLK
jgi:PAS domain S-box-containing protein